VRSSPEDRDPALLVDVEMSPLSVPELAFVQITDPAGPRFAIDRDPDGRDTLFGTASRNIDEERRAMLSGLAPGQVRRGQRLLSRVLDAMEGFCGLIGKEIYLIEPLFYHSAILYERRGCGYLMGRDVMEEIHAGFCTGGPLAKALDGSSDFRRAEAADTVRGRSWALHDGVGPGLWGGAGGGVKMYKAAGRPAGVNTFPGAPY
jgi:acetoin utilization protein AcuC